MFIGHFAMAFASKKISKNISLGTAFLAAQWLDLLWPVLLLTGVETVEINSAERPIPLTFLHYPVTHSLLAATGWAILFSAIYYFIKSNKRDALVVGILVLSHWVLDLLVHVPDLPLSPFASIKVGLGLWNYKIAELLIELILFAIGIYLYMRNTSAKNKTGKISLWALIILLVVIQLGNTFGAPPPSVKAVAIIGLTQWLLIFWAYRIDRNRSIFDQSSTSSPKSRHSSYSIS